MRKPNRALRVLGAAGLIIGLMVSMVAPVMAQGFDPGPGDDHNPITPPTRHLESAIYFPWVANDDSTLGLGPADTMISIQNLEDRDAEITISVGGSGGLTTHLSRYASKTFTAEELGLGSGTGAPVRVTALNSQSGFPARGYQGSEQLFPIYWENLLEEPPVDTPWGCFILRPEQANLLPPDPGFAPPGYQERINDLPREVPRSFIATVDIPYHEWERWVLVGNAWELQEFEAGPYPAGSLVHLDGQLVVEDEDEEEQDQGSDTYDLDVWFQIQTIWEMINGGDDGEINPFGGLGVGGNCNAWVESGVVHSPVAIGGVAKMAVHGESLPMTSAADAAVSGYNAINGWEVLRFDQWYLPIVQTNCGPGGCWDSTIRVAALGGSLNSVTVRFFPADDGSGSLQTGFQLQRKINGGTTWNINLSDYVPEGWVGSAHIYTDGAVYAMVDRFKVGYNMWITNTGSSADFENVAQVDLNTNTNLETGRYVLFAPHVLVDYFGWNTGINVANLADEHNNISIQYFNMFGNATQGASQRLAPHGMTYFYDPSIAPQNENEQDVETDTTGDLVASALIWSDYPVAAVIDATKYPESDPSGRSDLYQATSYSATANIYTWQAVPFVSKGNPIDGSGATSGINIMNPNPVAATANVYFVNENGFRADNFGVSSVTIPAYANGFVYTLWQENLPNGFYGAAQVISNVPVAAVSANVDYSVTGDGSAIFNAFNPCGFYRTNAGSATSGQGLGRLMPDCSFGNALDVTGGSVTKTFVDPDGTPIPGIRFSIFNQNPDFPYQQTGETGPDGTKMFTNVPVGDYHLIVDTDSVPADYMRPAVPADVFTMEYGDDLRLVNTLQWNQGMMKTVCVADYDPDGAPWPALLDECSGINLAGVNVMVFENIGEDFIGGQVAGQIVYEGVTDANGTVSASLPVGDYILCMYDEDGIAYTSNTGEAVVPDLPDDFYATVQCAQSIFGVEFELYGDLFTVVPMEVENLVNPVLLAEGILNIETNSSELCLVEDGVELECGSPVNGLVSFSGVLPGVVYSLTGTAVADAELSDSVLRTPNDNGSEFFYEPTIDLVQDNWVDDAYVPPASLGIPQGIPDMTANVGGTITVNATTEADSIEGVDISVRLEACPGALEVGSMDLDFNQIGEATHTFVDLAVGTYCVEMDPRPVGSTFELTVAVTEANMNIVVNHTFTLAP